MSTVVITGANRGIGLAMASQLAERGETVIAVCRSRSPELDALKIRVEDGVDVTDDGAVAQLAERLGDVKIDLLINNAGLLTNETLEDMNFDRIRQQLEVNTLGPLRVSAALLPKMSQGSKIALVTSRMGSVADNTSGSRYGYRISKCALNMAGTSLAHDVKDRGIAVALLHPGYVKTGMTHNTGNVEPPEAARGLIARIDALTLETSGGFWHANGESLPW